MRDILNSLENFRLVLLLANQDIRQRYRRSTLGPFWITISMGVMIACMGFVFGGIFKSRMSVFLPFLTIGIIFWTFISSVLLESCNAFVNAEQIIKQLQLPFFIHILRGIWRNLIILIHNLIIFPLVIFFYDFDVNINFFSFLLGFFLLIINLAWMSLLLSIVCCRYRDLTQIINSVLQVFYFITPIIWMPEQLNSNYWARTLMIEMNPFSNMIDIVRGPILFGISHIEAFLYVIFMSILGWFFTIIFFTKYKNRIAYWL